MRYIERRLTGEVLLFLPTYSEVMLSAIYLDGVLMRWNDSLEETLKLDEDRGNLLGKECRLNA
jgi:hypothetical protein